MRTPCKRKIKPKNHFQAIVSVYPSLWHCYTQVFKLDESFTEAPPSDALQRHMIDVRIVADLSHFYPHYLFSFGQIGRDVDRWCQGFEKFYPSLLPNLWERIGDISHTQYIASQDATTLQPPHFNLKSVFLVLKKFLP